MTFIARQQSLRFSGSGDRTENPLMDQQLSHGRNRLLGILPPSDLALLTPHLRDVRFEQGAMLQEAGEPIEQVYFPHNGMISLLAVMRDGSGIETATIGREGAVSVMAGFGSRRSASRAVMQVAGDVSHIASPKFRAAVESSAALRNLVVLYNDVQMALFQQTAGCNALHHVEKRFCRWLLQTRDRCDSDEIPLTQEFLSEMLGVQRTSVTLIARSLQTAGLIKYRRGRIDILDRDGLEKRSCECYETVRLRSEDAFLATT
jgi:CRP-like cAMP-binding protein